MTGRCGNIAPALTGGVPAFCDLPAGHAGWHRGDDGSEWSALPDDRLVRLAASRLRRGDALGAFRLIQHGT